MGIIIIWVVFALLVGWMADNTTLGFWGGFFLSILLSPIIGFIITLFYPSTKHREEQTQILSAAINNQNKSTLSTADEIEKLKNLLDKNIITKDEFEKQKAKLLA